MIYAEQKIIGKRFVSLKESTYWQQLILKRKKLKLLTKEQKESYEDAKFC